MFFFSIRILVSRGGRLLSPPWTDEDSRRRSSLSQIKPNDKVKQINFNSVSLQQHVLHFGFQHTLDRSGELKESNNKPNKKEQSHFLKHYVGDRILLIQSTIVVIVEWLFC